MGLVKTVANLGGMLHIFSSADYSGYNKMVEQYNKLISVWDELIDKKMEYISMSYGSEAMRAAQETLELINNEVEAWRALGKERLNAGASTGSSSIGKRITKNMSGSDWDVLAASLGLSREETKNLLGETRLTGLFDLSAEQLEKLKRDAPAFWAKLDEDVQKYLNGIIEGNEKVKEAEKARKEQLTATTFDSVYSNFLSTLSDMDKKAKDFSDDFSKYLFDAIMSNKMGAVYQQRLQDWYDMLAEAGQDDDYTEAEIEKLRNEWDAIVSEAQRDRDAIAKATGYGAANSPDQQATYNSLEKWSYDQADELISRATAMQIIAEHQYETLVENTQTQTAIQMDVMNIKTDISLIATNIGSIIEIQQDGNRKLDMLILNTNPIGEIRDLVKKLYNER